MENSLFSKYDLKKVINASGRMSILGVSTLNNHVCKAMKIGAQNYVEIADLVKKAGRYIANKLQCEAAIAVNSASSGIALSVAALVTKGNRRRSLRLHQEDIEKNEIIMFKGHNVQYGAPIETMIYLGGGKLIEVGYANEGAQEHIQEALNERTAAIIYVQSHHTVQKNMIAVEEAWEVAKEHHIPLIVDAAAEEDLQKYTKISDLAIFSGSKAIEGPTSGIVAGKKQYIDWVEMQLHGIGRSMKIGKEAIFGLLQALDDFKNKQDTSQKQRTELEKLLILNEFDGVSVQIVQDEAGRQIFRGRIHIDPLECGKTAKVITEGLKHGDIAIYTRDYGVNQGYFDIDPRPLLTGDMEIIVDRLKELVSKNV